MKDSKFQTEWMLCGMVFLLNMICLILGIRYVQLGKEFTLVGLYGFLLLLIFALNVIYSSRIDTPKWLSYTYLIIHCLWMLLLPLINTVFSIFPSFTKTRSPLSISMIFALFILGGYLSFLGIIKSKTSISGTEPNIEGVEEYKWINVKGKLTTTIKNIVIILLFVLLFSGIFVIFMILRSRSNGIIEAFTSGYGLFYGYFFIGIGGLLLKILKGGKHYIVRSFIQIALVIIVIVCFIPMIATCGSIKESKDAFVTAFSVKVLGIPEKAEGYFRKYIISIPDYFYGIATEPYQLRQDVVYYVGTTGRDQGKEFRFDTYMPPEGVENLPGGRTVLIRIHGGGWTAGDKGSFNNAQVNKYFASQGYVVFDIQYGLKQKNDFDVLLKSEIRRGDFTLDDMVRHIGIFTSYLVNHNEEYKGNLDSVFISGGSAGGQLALAIGLGLENGTYDNLLNSRLKVKGIVPLYPANGLADYLGVEGSKEWMDPIELVTKTSPPCLIYQGSNDGLVDSFITKRFQKEYERKENEKCAIITMPFGGHVSDLYFASYYSQEFIYFMERFLYYYK